MKYRNVGHVNFPFKSAQYVDQFSGVMTVRLLVEDVTLTGELGIVAGASSYAEDFLSGVDGFAGSGEEAFRYMNDSSRRFIDNILLGAANWAGVREVSPGIYEYFVATVNDLGTPAKAVYKKLQNHYGTSARLWIVTSLNKNMTNVLRVFEEAKATGLPSTDISVSDLRTLQRVR
jgi:hypothetical protein